MVIETASLANLSGAAVRNNSTFNPPIGSNVPLLRSVFPEIVEAIRSQFRMLNGMLYVLMPQVMLDRAGKVGESWLAYKKNPAEAGSFTGSDGSIESDAIDYDPSLSANIISTHS